MNVYEASVQQYKKMLTNLDKWLEAAESFAQKKSFDPNALLTARLAPDQYARSSGKSSRACDAAKFAAARLAGKEAPKHPDTEQTMGELHARIRACVSFLDSLKTADFAQSESRKIELPFLEKQYVLGSDYLTEMATPNFFFHVTTAYAILRHNGVDLGKRDFIGSLNVKDL